MPRLIQKCGYIRPGKAAGYMKYIATREGVEKFHGSGAATLPQKELIAKLLRDYPDTKDLFEYQDYHTDPTSANASSLISMALDSHLHTMQDGDGYLHYMATRPGAERHGEHGLFSNRRDVSLSTAMQEVHNHQGPVWTLIYSLRREDAARLGYDHADQWRALLMQQQVKLAQAMKIPPEQFHWYAAFHDEGHHPHIHMMAWSDDPKKGHLTRDGVLAMRSALTNAIFQDEMYHLYARKDLAYRELVGQARAAMAEHVSHLETSTAQQPIIAEKIVALAQALDGVTGKKQYGYLSKDTKALVDTIVDELATHPDVVAYYQVWNDLRDELERYYKDTPRTHHPLSQQKEFHAIKNVIIQEAEHLRQELGLRKPIVPTESEKQFSSTSSGPVHAAATPPHAKSSSYSTSISSHDPAVLTAVGRLLYHMGRICRDNAIPPSNPKGIRVESKRRKKLLEKRLALGHKANDHEELTSYTQSM